MRWLDSITDSMETEQTLGDSGGQEAWHAVAHGVTKSRTRLKRLSSQEEHKIFFICYFAGC